MTRRKHDLAAGPALSLVADESAPEAYARPPAPDLLDRVLDRVIERSEVIKRALLEHPELKREALHSADLLELVANYALAEFESQLEAVLAAERDACAAGKVYIAKRSVRERQQLANDVLALFNGRNVAEVARRLRIGRATVYRIIKQPGRGPRGA